MCQGGRGCVRKGKVCVREGGDVSGRGRYVSGRGRHVSGGDGACQGELRCVREGKCGGKQRVSSTAGKECQAWGSRGQAGSDRPRDPCAAAACTAQGHALCMYASDAQRLKQQPGCPPRQRSQRSAWIKVYPAPSGTWHAGCVGGAVAQAANSCYSCGTGHMQGVGRKSWYKQLIPA